MTCCFFGHKDAPSSKYDKLEEAVEKIIAEDGGTEFLIGNQGQFDSMALRALRRIRCFLVPEIILYHHTIPLDRKTAQIAIETTRTPSY